MAHSLEVRCPFLDPELVGFALALPRQWKFGGGVSKKILRDAFAEDLPPQVLQRPKAGFAAPIGRWLREDLSDLVEERIVRGFDRSDSPLCPLEVGRMARDHLAGRADHASRLWALLMLQLWIDQ
jgi:asparagine synthase (glutamine-hydrolysing)